MSYTPAFSEAYLSLTLIVLHVLDAYGVWPSLVTMHVPRRSSVGAGENAPLGDAAPIARNMHRRFNYTPDIALARSFRSLHVPSSMRWDTVLPSNLPE